MALVTLGLAVVPSGNVNLLDQTADKLDKVDKAQAKAKLSAAGLADGIGKVSTTLARSVGVLGLTSDSLRAIDDAADLAEVGLKGMGGGLKAVIPNVQSLTAAQLGAAGAAGALGFALGSLIRQIPGVASAMDKLIAKALELKFHGFAAGAGAFTIGEPPKAGPDQMFSAEMAAKRADAIKRQVEALKGMGRSIDDIAKTSGAALKAMLDPLAEGDKIAKLKELGFTTQEITKLIPALTDNLKDETDAQKAATEAAKQHAEEIKKLAESYAAPIEQAAKLNEAFADTAKIIALPDAGLIKLGEDMVKLADAGLVVPQLTTVFGELSRRGIDPATIAARELGKEIGTLKSAVGTFAGLASLTGGTGPGGLGAAAPFQLGGVESMAEWLKSLDEGKGKTEELTAATFDWREQLSLLADLAQTLPGIFGKVFGNILAGISGIGAALKQAGGLGGLGDLLKGGGAKTASGKFGNILGGIGVIGSVIGGVVGIFKGIFGDAKKKAEELKKKQQEAIDSFVDLYEQWQQLRRDIAAQGAESVNTLIDSLFKDGKFTGEFTSAANAAEYVAASFAMLREAGFSTAEALAKLKPALDAMAKDASKFAGSAAAGLMKMATFAAKNEGLLKFQAALADTAVALASFGMLTQDLANRISADMSASIQKMIDGGLSYQEALALSAADLFKLMQSAEKSGVTLDAHTQKMIDDAKAAGLFEGLQDPMEKLIEVQNAMLVAVGQLVTLFGGAVPDAIQEMIDAFLSAKSKTEGMGGGAESGTGGGGTGGGAEEGGGGGGWKNFQSGSGGIQDFRSGTPAMLHQREGVYPEEQVQRMIAEAVAAGAASRDSGTVVLEMDGEVVSRVLGRRARNNSGELLTLINQAQRRRGG